MNEMPRLLPPNALYGAAGYEPTNPTHRRHLVELLLWLYREVFSHGGDGFAVWVTRFPLAELVPVVQEADGLIGVGFWQVSVGKDIWWGKEQEGVLITNDKAAAGGEGDILVRY